MSRADDGPECFLTLLPKAWCDHCRDAAAGPRRRPQGMEGAEIRARFRARYAGMCGRCGERFQEGDTIAAATDGDYLCEECV